MGLFSSSFIPVYAAMATLSNRQYGGAIGGFWTAALLGYASATLIGGCALHLPSFDTLFLHAAYPGCARAPRGLFVPKDHLLLEIVLVHFRSHLWLLQRG